MAYNHLISLAACLLPLLWIVEGDIQCRNSEQCNCFTALSNQLEFQCPPQAYETKGVVLHLSENRVQMDCYTTASSFNADILPIWENSGITAIDMKSCSIPETSFKDVLNKLTDPKDIIELRFRYMFSNNSTLMKNVFNGLENLKRLDLSSNDLTDLHVDIFKDIPKLIELSLADNKIQLKPEMFQHIPNLEILTLYRNYLNDLPDGIFDNLTNLKSLELWGNHLTNLTRNHFRALENLKVLDLLSNKIQTLDEDVFYDLKQLTKLSLQINSLTTLPSNLFQNNLKLELIRLTRNPLQEFPDKLFANITTLKSIDLSECKLKNISGTAFEGLENLETLTLHNNNLEHLSEDLFNGLNSIQSISLNGNKLERLPNFPKLKNLTKLLLQNNLITKISSSTFNNLVNLKEINLANNRITTIEFGFQNNQKLEKINLSFNNYGMEQLTELGSTPFNACTNLKELDLSHNQISYVDATLIISMLNLKLLNMSHNYIEQISFDLLYTLSHERIQMDFSNNKITTLDFSHPKELEDTNSRPGNVVDLANNPIRCDCQMEEALKYFRDEISPNVKYAITISNENLACQSPTPFANIPLRNLAPHMLVCPLEEYLSKYNYKECPDSCECNWRPYDRSVIVDCSYQHLKKPPVLMLPSTKMLQYNQTEVHLEGNNLTKCALHEVQGYANVTRLYLSNNAIEKIESLPPKIEVLNIDNNRLKRLSSTLIKFLNSSTVHNVSLHNNPWTCDCDSVDLTDFIRNNLHKMNSINIRCKINGTRLLDLNANSLCLNNKILISSLTILCILSVIILIVCVLYYKNQEAIRIWLYSRGLCLWWVSEEELDKDKEFDAFLSYATKDEDFVLQNLVPVLESGTHPYKLCFHRRNFIPGEFITAQINSSVRNSCRTIIVLSKNFLESQWAKQEFHTAHTFGMNEKRIRVIVILLEDIDTENIDEEINTYLKTNTYVKWGEAHFWDKLRYALPHGKHSKPNNSEKHSKTMNKIDDKFSLTPAFTPDPNTTPPVLTLDASLLKKHPLNLVNNRETPPAEAGLLTHKLD